MQEPDRTEEQGCDARLRGRLASAARTASGAAALARGIEPRSVPIDDAWNAWTEALGGWARQREVAAAGLDAALGRLKAADEDWAARLSRCGRHLNWDAS